MAASMIRFSAVSKSLWYNIKLPDKYKGGKIEKITKYFQSMYIDYKEVVIDTITECRDRPVRASFIASGLGFLYYCYDTNPTEQSYLDRYILNSNRYLMVVPQIQNPDAGMYLKGLGGYFNEGLIRRFSFGIFSIIWLDNYDRNCDIYSAQCSFLKTEYLKFPLRIIDFGFLDKWHVMRRCMIDYDVNPGEWTEQLLKEVSLKEYHRNRFRYKSLEETYLWEVM